MTTEALAQKPGSLTDYVRMEGGKPSKTAEKLNRVGIKITQGKTVAQQEQSSCLCNNKPCISKSCLTTVGIDACVGGVAMFVASFFCCHWPAPLVAASTVGGCSTNGCLGACCHYTGIDEFCG